MRNRNSTAITTNGLHWTETHVLWCVLNIHSAYVRSYMSFSSIITVQYASKQTRYHMMSAFFFMHIIFISIRSFHSSHPLFLLFSYIFKLCVVADCHSVLLFIQFPVIRPPSTNNEMSQPPIPFSCEWIYDELNGFFFCWTENSFHETN